MIDLLRGLLIGMAVVHAARARYVTGVVMTLGCAALLAIEIALPLLYPMRPVPVTSALAFVFLGPTSLPTRVAITSDGVLDRGLPMGLAFVLTCVAFRGVLSRVRELRPEMEHARRLDRAGLAFVAQAVVLGLLLVAVVLMRVVSPPL